MSNFIKWGMDWHSKLRNQYATTMVKITYKKDGQQLTTVVAASLVDPESYINVNGVRVKTDHMVCMVNRVDVAGIEIVRGIRIEELDSDTQQVISTRRFEVILEKLIREEYDDPKSNTLNIPIKHIAS